MRLAAVLCAVSVAGGCTVSSPETGNLEWLELPEHVPPPRVPANNPLTWARAELGRHLFYDPRLSGRGTIACSACHQQERAFADFNASSVGGTGEMGTLNAPSLAGAGYMHPLTWASTSTETLEAQLLRPMFGTDPVEMGMSGFEGPIVERLRSDDRYIELFELAFPDAGGTIDLEHARLALASFVRSLVSYRAPFDEFLAGDLTALSPRASRGAELFFSRRLGCGTCHSGFALTTATVSARSGGPRVSPFHNIGLYDVDGEGSYPDPAQGLYAETGLEQDMGRFRVPSLRNVAVTAPYMHDGSVATLEEVVRIYEQGGRVILDGDLAGDGRASPFRSRELTAFELSDAERADLLAFLGSLTDEALLTDSRWADPW